MRKRTAWHRGIVVVVAMVSVGLGTWSLTAADPAGETPATQPAAEPTSQPAAAAADSRDVFRVVCFGDSITGHRPGVAYQHQYLKYADLLGLMLSTHADEQRVETINSGYAGDATYPHAGDGRPGAVARVKSDVLDREPSVVVVLIGGNDKVTDDASRQRTLDNLKQIFKAITDAEHRLLVLQYPPALPDPDDDSRAWHQLSAKNDLIAEAAAAVKAPVLDLGPAMLAADKRYDRAELADPIDGVHLRPRGEMVVATAIYRKLRDLGWLPK